MFQREKAEGYTCPLCGSELRRERNDELRCQAHGAFFAYGPNLVVRAPEGERRDGRIAMPWDQAAKRA